jgi:benzodiazapine receptor
MKKIILFLIFLIINFGALALGSWLMQNGPISEWYLHLNKAPWTPPGWLFGAAWTTIMLCFSVYMTFLLLAKNNTKLKMLFILQVILNVSWNYIFFNKHLMEFGLLIILLLTILILYFLIHYKNKLKLKSLLILPYFLWLCIATSLNFYIVLYN